MRAVNIFASLIMIAMLAIAVVSASSQAKARQESALTTPVAGPYLPDAR